MLNKLALGMFTVNRAVAEDMAGTFKRLRQMGYTGIEFYGEPSDFPAAEVKRAIAESGLELTSWHVEWRNLQPETFAGTVAYLKDVGCPIAVVPCLGGKWNVNHTPEQESRRLWEDYVVMLNAICDKLRAEGLRMGYHNHEHEFLLVYDGRPVFDILFEGLHPEVVMEFDTGNCIEGGYDPARVLQKYPGRDVLLHLKPFSHGKGFDVVLGDGDDENDWAAILKANPEKVLQLIVESENAVLPEWDNAQKCLDGLKKFL